MLVAEVNKLRVWLSFVSSNPHFRLLPQTLVTESSTQNYNFSEKNDEQQRLIINNDFSFVEIC